MAKWWTDGDCVRWVKTFDAMSWPYKVMDLSVVLAPIAMNSCAYLEPDTTPMKYFRWSLDWVLAGLYWLIVLQLIANHIRGRLAISRGVEPAPAKKPPNLQSAKRFVIFSAAWIGVVFAIVLLIHLFVPGSRNNVQDWGGALFMIALFSLSLSDYTRARYWNSVPSAPSPAMAS